MRRRSSRTDKCHALFDVLILPLAGNGDRVVADFDGHIVRFHAGQVRTDDELVPALDDVDFRHP